MSYTVGNNLQEITSGTPFVSGLKNLPKETILFFRMVALPKIETFSEKPFPISHWCSGKRKQATGRFRCSPNAYLKNLPKEVKEVNITD